MAAQLKLGDNCQECQSLGLTHKLRYFYINFEEQLLKCESRTCLWPHNDEVSSDEEQEMHSDSKPARQVDDADDDDAFIRDLMEQLESTTEPQPDFSFNFNMPDLELEVDNAVESHHVAENMPIQKSTNVEPIIVETILMPSTAEEHVGIKETPDEEQVLIKEVIVEDQVLKIQITVDTASSAELQKSESVNDLKPSAQVIKENEETSVNSTASEQMQNIKTNEKVLKSETPTSSEPAPKKENPFSSTFNGKWQIKKASIIPRKIEQTSPKSDTTVTTFLDAVKRQPQTPIRSARGPRVKRVINSPESVRFATGFAPGQRLNAVRQLLNSIEAREKQEIQTEATNFTGENANPTP
ncbi:uncharacterized protein LOC108597022 [Drosophila busckii]|uniref:uncharacterized protein LOC108597022 n=1 Tax=Drosophila busckii TaxID=30019 RepID=UPI00083EACB4|nr:uncharacterized protein LOC108597022 [Drosophila busckii]